MVQQAPYAAAQQLTPVSLLPYVPVGVAQLAQIVANELHQTRLVQQQILWRQDHLLNKIIQSRLEEEAAHQRRRQREEAALREQREQRREQEEAWAAMFQPCPCCSNGATAPGGKGGMYTPHKRRADDGVSCATPFSIFLGEGSPFQDWLLGELSPPSKLSPKRLRF